MDQKSEQSPLELIGMHIDPEAGKQKTRAKLRYFPSAPSIFRILSLWIIFLSITAVVAGCISGDWGASLCEFMFIASPFFSFNHLYLLNSIKTPLPRPFPHSFYTRSLVHRAVFTKRDEQMLTTITGVLATLLFLEAFIWLEKTKIQEMQGTQYGFRGWNISLGISNRGLNRLLYAWAGIGADGALLG
jgi:hypothetical protein